ncbi:hypothetical protein EGR_06507 [Echinococcus granulosus]|uniref:Uncharacterized protein n=1 Tax=Echinococcus granulosus TaxID=6210 RepID=W6UYH6_ECHGR|nr:hypothetical protein EGR_06507 [Echinococcus granulosus]EUB58624.1 hypothetical protein EGR_06507 [Echinococcus granulosus]
MTKTIVALESIKSNMSPSLCNKYAFRSCKNQVTDISGYLLNSANLKSTFLNRKTLGFYTRTVNETREISQVNTAKYQLQVPNLLPREQINCHWILFLPDTFT